MTNKIGVEDEHNPCHQGPIKNRGCTDVICLFLGFAFCFGWVAAGKIQLNSTLKVFTQDLVQSVISIVGAFPREYAPRCIAK